MNDATFIHLGLIGFPLGHSYSPRLHAAAFESCNLNGDYHLFQIPPFPKGKKTLTGLLQKVRDEEIVGINVTIPHKQNVLSLLDQLTPSAQSIGAVNTIYLKDDRLIGDNTDARGFIRDLNRHFPPQPEQKQVLVLGAGGSSRAVTFALSRNGWQVAVAARRLEQARELAKNFSTKDDSVESYTLTESTLKTLTPSLIVNTTPVGMFPHVTESPWPSSIPFPAKAFIYDLVYNPTETLLVRQAKEAGLNAVNGLGMLIEQAALSFEIWTGHSPSRTALMKAVSSQILTKEVHKE
jgi:shikimate dehydrogenase